ncbi:hypothetical protein JW948_14280 [bacterium]|nr:hypothetical protein [bacterium]
MKRGFIITNGIAAFFALIATGWLVYDFYAFNWLYSRMMRMESLTSTDNTIGIWIWIGLLVFLIFHILSFIAVANQFQRFKKATLLRIFALILGIISCILILNDIACLSDIFKEYGEGLEVQSEWNWLYGSSIVHGLFFVIMSACLIEAFIQDRKSLAEITAVKDEVIFTVVHSVGVICGGIGLFSVLAAWLEQRAHALLHITFPFLFILSLIPYALLAGYWLVMKLKEKPADWYDEKQFRDISRSGLLTMFASIPFMAFAYVMNYGWQQGPIRILWFPLYLYFTIFLFSLSTLIMNWKE